MLTNISLYQIKFKKITQADVSEYYAIQIMHISPDKIVKNRNIISDFPREDTVTTFQ
jgi:superfamily I DNA and/or RNA helicase